ncbi:MAG: hypothetical protein AAGB31_04430 [Bdellovibrio sp.]
MLRLTKIRFFLLLCLAGITSCGGGGGDSAGTYSTPQIYFQSTQKIVVEVYYEPGAEPFTGTTAGGLNYWSVLEDNLNAIFQYRSSTPVMVVPKTLGAMTALPTQNRTEWLGTDILSLNSSYKQGESTSLESRFYLYFLKGYYSGGFEC